MHKPWEGPTRQEVTVAALAVQPFTLYLLALHFLAPPTQRAWAHADPILLLLPRSATLWLAPLSGLVVAAIWWRVARPTTKALRTGARDALIGAAVAAAAVGLLRLAVGPAMPAFIPPEESATPGFLLSMTAGYQEEVVCRLVVLPLAYFALRNHLPRPLAIAVPVLLTGLVFAAWHIPGDPTFSSAYFATRFIIPGCAMSVVWLVSPPAIVVAHCTAHLLIPWLFTGP